VHRQVIPAREGQVFLDQVLNARYRDPQAPLRDEQRVGSGNRPAGVQVVLQGSAYRGIERDDAFGVGLLVAHTYPARRLMKLDVVPTKPYQLTDSQAALQKELQDGEVAGAVAAVQVDRCYQAAYLGLGQSFRLAGQINAVCAQVACQVASVPALGQNESAKRTQGRNVAIDRCWLQEPIRANILDEGLQVGFLQARYERPGFFQLLAVVAAEGAHRGAIGGNGGI